VKQQKTLSCGIVLVHKGAFGCEYLMLRSYSYWEPGPKGKQIPNELDIETALRECTEETGILPDQLEFRWDRIHQDTEVYGKGKIARWFLAYTDVTDLTLPINSKIAKPEHDEYRWCSYDEALQLAGPRIKAILNWAHNTIEHGG
jgi:8-oxo-dGTP pyrophosphatase MutT (NUDIX family)